MKEKLQKIYVSPSAKRGVGYPSPYFYHLKDSLSQYYRVLEPDSRPSLMQGTAILRNSFKADVFLLSFLESIGFQKLGFLQFCMAHTALWNMRMRGKQLVFIFHNSHPHQGEDWMSRSIENTLFRHSSLVVSHSKSASEYARERIRLLFPDDSSKSDKVKYICHPVAIFDIEPLFPQASFENGDIPLPEEQSGGRKLFDVLIWGSIMPYKGVYEFISRPQVQNGQMRVQIVGKSKDRSLSEKIRSACSEHVVFENRFPDFGELAWYIQHSRFVLFPYLPGSISSSGALIDTVSMGGTPLGPDVGAFKDLSEEGVSYVYKDAEDLIRILQSKEVEPISREAREAFLKGNSWEHFAAFLKDNI